MNTDVLGEMLRLTDGNKLARPTPVRDLAGRWKRHPGAEWDWFYSLPESERAYIQRHHMADKGLGPDELATRLDCSIDEATGQWVAAVRGARKPISSDPLEDGYDFADAAHSPEDTPVKDRIPLYIGTRGLADLFGVARSTPRVWRQRGRLPEPCLFVDDVHPVWSREVVEEWLCEIRSMAG